MRLLNLGILAHVDAGKTSLTERLLHTGGVIDHVGSVDEGNTQADSMELEKQRGITIKSAVVSFSLDDVGVNLIDTPGHPDFIAEVERVLRVPDGAVMVISAVEGVQAQTPVLMHALQRLKIPTLIFVNKIDLRGARAPGVIREIAEKLTPDVVAMGSVYGLGTRQALFEQYSAADKDFRAKLIDLLAAHDDALLAAYVDDTKEVSYRRLLLDLADQTNRAIVHPLFFGSAMTGAGVESLIGGIRTLLPSVDRCGDGPASGTVFKIDRGPAGEKIAYVRMFTGAVRVRERLQFGEGKEGKVTAISVFEQGTAARCSEVVAGEIAMLWGLAGIRIGDAIGVPPRRQAGSHFPSPTLETTIVPVHPADRGALRAALNQLEEQDPLINLRQDDVTDEIFVSLYGAVQKEVIEATLANDFGVEVTFERTTTICIERPIGTGAAVETIGIEPNPLLATVGLRVDPAPIGSGLEFKSEVELGSMPRSFFTAIGETVYKTLRQGIYGWQVTDCTVSLTHSGYWARQSRAHGTFDKSMSSTASDFRALTPLVLMEALKQAGTNVYEPIQRFTLEIPADIIGSVLKALARLRAVPYTPEVRGPSCIVEGQIPVAQVHELRQELPGLSRGEGVLETWFDSYQLVRGAVPTKARWKPNPLERAEYLTQVKR